MRVRSDKTFVVAGNSWSMLSGPPHTQGLRLAREALKWLGCWCDTADWTLRCAAERPQRRDAHCCHNRLQVVAQRFWMAGVVEGETRASY